MVKSLRAENATSAPRDELEKNIDRAPFSENFTIHNSPSLSQAAEAKVQLYQLSLHRTPPNAS